MPAVLVHGVPDTDRLWNRVCQHLQRKDVIAVKLPGFDSPVPEGFSATKEEYVDWLIAQIEAVGDPVDLVGHDFGCILTSRVAALRPDLIRTWTGISGPIDPEYEPHPFAKACETPGVGEAMMAEMTVEGFVKQLIDAKVPREEAESSTRFFDAVMKDCVLKLYRSASRMGEEWYPDLKNITSPSMVIWGYEDEFLPHRFADSLGQASASEVIVKFRAGHWVPLQKPAEVARVLEGLWS
ncbi:alpha/beta fold hydrolase [Bradyrhizobium sp. UFLA05-112]